VIDTKKEHLAVDEARKLGLPVIAILDTNCDPDEVDYKIPGNDDAIRSITVLTRVIADAVAEQMRKLAYYPSFWDFGNEPAARLAERVASLLPADRGLRHVLFHSSGSEANEAAFRIARLYHAVQGKTGFKTMPVVDFTARVITKGFLRIFAVVFGKRATRLAMKVILNDERVNSHQDG